MALMISSFKIYNFIIMQGNFNINLPSIPGAILKFKIQDVRFKGFLSKEARFKDNKTYLTKRFINSFPNLQPKPSPKVPQTEENKSQLSTNLSSSFRKQQQNYRVIVPNQKKNLLIKYEDYYKQYNPPILGENKYDKGYSFPKEGLNDTLDGEIKKYQSQIVMKEGQNYKIDNYYFNQTENSDQEDQQLEIQRRRQERLAKRKQLRPSAAFKSQERWEHNERILRSKIKPGPGSYINEQQKSFNKDCKKKDENPQNLMQNISRIKEILKDYKDYKPIIPLEAIQQKNSTLNHNTSSFIDGNIDRFGQQKYPISYKVNIPGPGQYETHGNLQQKAKKISILQEQRKLLKEWYNQ